MKSSGDTKMVMQQNINLAADLTLTPKSNFDFRMACKMTLGFVGLLLLVSAFSGLSLAYNLFRENQLKREHADSVKVLADYEKNYYVINQARNAGHIAGSGGAERIGRVYYILRSLAQHKLPGAKLSSIVISQGEMELSGVADSVDVALRLGALLKEKLGMVVKFEYSSIRQSEENSNMINFFLTTNKAAAQAEEGRSHRLEAANALGGRGKMSSQANGGSTKVAKVR